MKRVKTEFLLLMILLLGFVLRFYQLGKIPVGFHKDEAYLGYNAYSILKTGRDINGNFLPLHLQSFLYCPAGYSYLSILPIALFGLSPFAVRLPSALFGSLTVLLVYFLVKKLFKSSYLASRLSIISSLLLAISPWHINLSRTATENIPVVFLIVLGLIFWISWQEKKKYIFLILTFLAFGLSFNLYQAPRAFLPIFLPILLLIYFRKSKFAWGLYLLTIILPLLLVLKSNNLSLRLKTVSFFSSPQTKLIVEEQIREDGMRQTPVLLTRFFHNRIQGYLIYFTKNYFSHLNYDFLFTDAGFPDRYRVPLVGLLYLFELPLLLVGLVALVKKEKTSWLIFTWIGLGIVGSALAFDDVPNLQRTLLITPALSIINAYGLLISLNLLKKIKFKEIIFLIYFLFSAYNFLFYLHQYYIHGPQYRAWYRNDGYRDLVAKVNQLLPNYRKAIITNYESAPTIFFLFFSRYDPAVFQKETKGTTFKDFDRINFYKYEFSTEQCPLRLERDKNGGIVSTGEAGILYIDSGQCDKLPEGAKELARIMRGDDSLVFKILKYQK